MYVFESNIENKSVLWEVNYCFSTAAIIIILSSNSEWSDVFKVALKT